jgi:hypothetical protein
MTTLPAVRKLPQSRACAANPMYPSLICIGTYQPSFLSYRNREPPTGTGGKKAAETRDASTRSVAARFNEGLLCGWCVYHLKVVVEGIATYEDLWDRIMGPGELLPIGIFHLMRCLWGKPYFQLFKVPDFDMEGLFVDMFLGYAWLARLVVTSTLFVISTRCSTRCKCGCIDQRYMIGALMPIMNTDAH